MRYKEAKKEDLSKDILKVINECIEQNKGLFIYGGTGTGKTYTMHALAKGKGTVENFVSLLVEMRDAMQKGVYFDKMKDLVNQEYLFIDDIGSEKTSEFVIEFLYLVVNKRYENMKRTVLSTNLSIEEFANRYGDRILSRIEEMCLHLELKGEDRRI